jgi:hypothetical protein
VVLEKGQFDGTSGTNQSKSQIRAESCASARSRPVLGETIPASEMHSWNSAECPLHYCVEIRHQLTFLINIYHAKDYHKLDHSIRIVECHRKKLSLSLNPTSSPGLEPSTIFAFVSLIVVITSPKQTILFFSPFFYRG